MVPVARVMALAILLSLTSIASADSFFCASEMSTGFKWNGSKWEHARFNTNEEKFLIRPYSDPLKPESDYGVFKIGSEIPSHSCKNTNKTTEPIHLICGGLGWGFIFSQATMRFQDYYGIGFIDGQDSTENTPSLTIGKCSPID